jgi:hypothetical protein
MRRQAVERDCVICFMLRDPGLHLPVAPDFAGQTLGGVTAERNFVLRVTGDESRVEQLP